MQTLSIDIETFSDVDLLKSGVYAYTTSPAFQILLFAYAFGDDPIKIIDLASGEKLPQEIISTIKDDSITKTAFNAMFERTCLSKHLGAQLSPIGWSCTAVQSAMLGLPLSLAGVAQVLGLEQQKMSEGKALIRYFSIPCKPTATNEYRTRNLPHHAPDKWQTFKDYCIQDVEVERSIRAKIAKYPISETEQNYYILDQQINDRGVMVDLKLVNNAIKCDALFKEKSTAKAVSLTGLDNPNSVAQLKQWLSQNDVEIDSLSKKVVADLVQTSTGDVEQMLNLRLQLSKTSIKKYEAITRSVCTDNRVRGLFQFYGANRTGRFSGRLVQVQNLPQNHIPDLELARNLVRNGDFEILELLFDDVPTVLSELIRTAFVPNEGKRFIVADFSSIERVVLAWLAGEQWVLESYAQKKDLYVATASQMFNVPIEKIDKKSHLRQRGKVADLACIAEGQLVLTDKGLVPIEKITLNHKLWDGEAWVCHEGVICKSKQDCINADGVTCTPNHKLLTKEGWVESGKCSGFSWEDVRSPNSFISSKEQQTWKIKMAMPLQLWCGKRFHFRKFNKWKYFVMWLLGNRTENKTRILKKCGFSRYETFLSSVVGYEESLQESKARRLAQLWGSWNKRIRELGGFHQFSKSYVGKLLKRFNYRPHRYQWELRVRKLSLGHNQNKQSEHEEYKEISNSNRKSLCVRNSRNIGMFQKHCKGSNKEWPSRKIIIKTCNPSKKNVYDILNCGDKECFSIWNGSSLCLVHNCGFGGSVGALTQMGALDMGLQESELQGLVTAWRTANPNIVKLWSLVDKAAIKAVRDKTSVTVGRIKIHYESGIMFITLPSGRKLSYIKPRLEVNKFGRDGITYEGIVTGKKWDRIDTFGGKLVENIVQAIARDLLVEAMMNVENKGYPIVMHCHDEVIIEAENGSLKDVCDIMAIVPSWANGLLLRADGYECDFYKKE